MPALTIFRYYAIDQGYPRRSLFRAVVVSLAIRCLFPLSLGRRLRVSLFIYTRQNIHQTCEPSAVTLI